MIRIVFIVCAIIAATYLLSRIVRELRGADVDWRGVAFAFGFVAIAVYLRHTTEIGGIG
ncbi:hypothetical protein [Mesorhizobium sp. CAU 1732]|uniref:hypothetical protein n=1 Tax=Mesorhizobium sp. CAU 1732 TaxID=3140358 RepID=UPI0032601CA4